MQNICASEMAPYRGTAANRMSTGRLQAPAVDTSIVEDIAVVPDHGAHVRIRIPAKAAGPVARRAGLGDRMRIPDHFLLRCPLFRTLLGLFRLRVGGRAGAVAHETVVLGLRR